MFVHIFALRWKPEATEADQARAVEEIRAFRGVIPGLIEVCMGPNLSKRGQGYTFACLMKFVDKEAADFYAIHPTHLALLRWLVPLVEAIDLDFEADA
jgi:hypothetical protein